MDQAIQPGDGGIGFSLEFAGIQTIVQRCYLWVLPMVNYLFNPRESNGTFQINGKIRL